MPVYALRHLQVLQGQATAQCSFAGGIQVMIHRVEDATHCVRAANSTPMIYRLMLADCTAVLISAAQQAAGRALGRAPHQLADGCSQQVSALAVHIGGHLRLEAVVQDRLLGKQPVTAGKDLRGSAEQDDPSRHSPAVVPQHQEGPEIPDQRLQALCKQSYLSRCADTRF